MAPHKQKSRTFRRIPTTTPGGKHVIHHKKRKHSKAQCGSCHAPLLAVPRMKPNKMWNMPKTERRPERPYGGVLCSACTRRLFITKSRS
ncbi:50S ribosomal protein L34e [Candidatus Woesearchaeota archaeon]|nr:50S ribosomal protein L34e [Candidatus Woesearchaeota archaeon]